MKSIKPFILVVIIFVLLFSLSGCVVERFINRTFDYSFSQSLDNVKKVEICEYNHDSRSTTTIAVLDKADADEMLLEISAMKCKRHFGDHTTNYGKVVVYITYEDQTAEVIGLFNVADVDVNGKWHRDGSYFDCAQMCTLIMKYVDEDLLPDLSLYFE